MKSQMIFITITLLSISITCDTFANLDSRVDESRYRQLITQQNQALIRSHNQNNDKGFRMKDYPQFIDQTFPELSSKLLISLPKSVAKDASIGAGHILIESPRPTSKSGLLSYFPFSREKRVNWTQRGMVSPVRDQGFCGSCYAFAALADIQSSYLFKGKKIDLSQQQIIDCSKAFGNQGCNGGWMNSVFAYVMLKGVTSEYRYPLSNQTMTEGVEGQCLQRKGEFKIRNYAYTSLRTYDCLSLTNMVQQRPVTVPIAIDMYFFFYWDGILTNCGMDLNHGVLLTGFVETINTNFWIIKNSWGTWWGMQGYAQIDRYSRYGNLCQICYAPSYSIV